MPDYHSYNDDRSQKICFKCKEMLDVECFRIREKKTGRGKGKYLNNTCKPCDSQQVVAYRKTEAGLAAEIVRRTKYNCKKNNLPFDLDKEWVFKQLNHIGWKCQLTNLPFNLRLDTRVGFHWDSLSVDRIDPKGGYTKSNIRFILNQINVFRQDHPDEQMYMLAQALLSYRDKDE